MVNRLKDYIGKYMTEAGDEILPGEHHFVAVYFAPKIWSITGEVPRYINPDGTKKLPGDLIYDKNRISFEAKYNKIMFTRTQWESWFNRGSKWKSSMKVPAPSFFVGICESGMVIREWNDFTRDYLSMISELSHIDLEKYTIKVYSPQISIRRYIDFLGSAAKSNVLFVPRANGDYSETEIEQRLRDIFA